MGTHSNVVVSKKRRSGYAVFAVLLIGANNCGEPDSADQDEFRRDPSPGERTTAGLRARAWWIPCA